MYNQHWHTLQYLTFLTRDRTVFFLYKQDFGKVMAFVVSDVIAESSCYQVGTRTHVHKQTYTRMHANVDTRIMEAIILVFRGLYSVSTICCLSGAS